MSNKQRSFKRKMRTETLTMPVDPNDVQRYRPQQNALIAAFEAFDQAQESGKGNLASLEARLSKAQEALDAKIADLGVPTMTFTFRAMSPAALQGLLADWPATEDQIAAARKTDPDAPSPEFDADEYPPRLISAACVGVDWSDDGSHDDGISVEDAKDLLATSSTGDQAMMMRIIGGVNNVPSLVSDLGKGSGGTRGSGPSPTTAAPEASPPASS